MRKSSILAGVCLAVMAWTNLTPNIYSYPQSDPCHGYEDLIMAAARETGVDCYLIAALIRQCSDFKRVAVDGAGNKGLMLLTPEMMRAYAVSDPFNVAQNVVAGSRYLASLLFSYDGDVTKAVAAYKAGPGLVDKFDGIPPDEETRIFVHQVLRYRDAFALMGARGKIPSDLSRWAGTWVQGPYRFSITVLGTIWSATFEARISGDAAHSLLKGSVSDVVRDKDDFVGHWQSAFSGSEGSTRQTGIIILRLVPGETPEEDRLLGLMEIQTDQARTSAGRSFDLNLERE